MVTVSTAVSQATATLAAAGVASPLFDAQLLAAHILGCGHTQLFLHNSDEMPAEYELLVSRRAAREPLQHIVGTAPMGHLDLAVGPGVFVPRPETELLGDWAVRTLRSRGVDRPRVLDLCAGSGALALYVATLVPEASVVAVELDPAAAQWTQHNIAAHAPGVKLMLGDVTDPRLLTGVKPFDVIVSNPPYVPEMTAVEPEVQRDPHHAVFSGETGMDVIRGMVHNVARLLRPGGAVGIEHDDSTAAEVCAVLAATGMFSDIVSHQDFGGRDRYVTATKNTE